MFDTSSPTYFTYALAVQLDGTPPIQTAELKEFLVQQEVQRAIPDFFARLNKEAQIEMLDPKYRLVTATAGDVAPPKKP